MRKGMRAHGLWPALAALLMAVALASAAGGQTARAAGPGPCAEISSADQAQASLTAAGGVTAQLNRTQGTVGTMLAVSGAHWPAGAAVTVDLYAKRNGTVFLDSPVAHGTASADGGFTLDPFPAPVIVECSSLDQNRDGGTILLLIHTDDGHARAPLTFTYLVYSLGPRVTTSNLGGFGVAPGTRFIVRGAGWEPGEHVALTPEKAPWDVVTEAQPSYTPITSETVNATADSQGAFVATLLPLDEPPETQMIVLAQGTGPRYGAVSEYAWGSVMLPKVFPSIQLDHSGVTAGAALTVTGDHWPANVSGIIEYCRQQSGLPGMVGLRCLGGQYLGGFQTDADGRFSGTVRLPANASLGPVTVQARVPSAPLGLIVYAQGQPLSIIPTFAEAHPRLTRLIAVAPYLAGSGVALLALLAALGIALWRRQTRRQAAA